MAKFKQKEVIVTRRVVRVIVEAYLYDSQIRQEAVINALTKIRHHTMAIIPYASFKRSEDDQEMTYQMYIDMVFEDWDQSTINDHVNEVIKFIERYKVVRVKEQAE